MKNLHVFSRPQHISLRPKLIVFQIGGMLIIASCLYLLMGLISLGWVVLGEDIPYDPFWHWPWRWAFDKLGYF